YCTSKRKHKIEYLDGDKEWSVLDDVEVGHLQLFNHECWLMYENYVASERATKAALYVNVRLQRYDVATFAWKTGKIRWFDDTSGLFCVAYDDASSGVDGSVGGDEMVDLLGCEDEFQLQDRRSFEWMGPGAYFFGPAYAATRVQDYMDYTGPYEEPMPNDVVDGGGGYGDDGNMWNNEGGEAVAYGDWTENDYATNDWNDGNLDSTWVAKPRGFLVLATALGAAPFDTRGADHDHVLHIFFVVVLVQYGFNDDGSSVWFIVRRHEWRSAEVHGAAAATRRAHQSGEHGNEMKNH
ncbi:hypothetical protein DYB31_009598, partial [Aphanomyces astaci]